MIRSSTGDEPEVGLAVARAGDGTWLVSDGAEASSQPPGRQAGRDDVVAALVERFGADAGVGA